mgnify:CR=1 FL=1
MFLYESALKAINTKIEILNEEFIHMYGHTPIEHIKSRVKTPDSIVKKMKRNGYEVTIENMVEKLSDIAGIRIICSFNQDIYQIADMIARQKDVTVLYVKDYIRKPKPNGYKSYHMVVTIPIYLTEGPVETKVEIQIRTIAQDFWASLEHKIYYKFEGSGPDSLQAEGMCRHGRYAGCKDVFFESVDPGNQKGPGGRTGAERVIYEELNKRYLADHTAELETYFFVRTFILWNHDTGLYAACQPRNPAGAESGRLQLSDTGEYRKLSDPAGDIADICCRSACRHPDPVTGDGRTDYRISGVSLLSEADPFAYPVGRSAETER